MSDDEKNAPKKRRKPRESAEHKCEKRTADFLARRIDEAQDRLYDLILDMRTFEHYSEIEDIGWSLMLLQKLKKKYRKFAETGNWPE